MIKKAYDEFGRPCFDLYFMNLCFDISIKSLDPNTKHGCLVVDKEGSTLSTGYNSPPRKCNDKIIPLYKNDVPYLNKYSYMVHSESNAICSAAKKGTSIENSIFYITGFPCVSCLELIIQSGAYKVVYGPLSSNMFTEDYMKIYDILLDGQSIIIERFKYDKELLKLNRHANKAVLDKQNSGGIIKIDKEYNV